MRWPAARSARRRAPQGTTRRNPFDAVPLVAPGVSEEPREAPEGLLLRRRLAPRSRLGAALARGLRYERSVHLKLDRPGAFFWRLIDGARDLDAIAGLVRAELQMSEEDARRATLLYVKELMTRNFIQLRVDAPAATPAPSR